MYYLVWEWKLVREYKTIGIGKLKKKYFIQKNQKEHLSIDKILFKWIFDHHRIIQ